MLIAVIYYVWPTRTCLINSLYEKGSTPNGLDGYAYNTGEGAD